MKWKPKVVGESIYDLSHLHPCTITMTWPARGEWPEKIVVVAVQYSMHCFTAAIGPENPLYDAALEYKDSRETRQFDLQRYVHSKELPGVIGNLSPKLCHRTAQGNYYIALPHPDCVSLELRLFVYFTLGKSSHKNADLTMYIASAYCKSKLSPRRGVSFKELCGQLMRP